MAVQQQADYEGQPLPIPRLVAIWRGLPEQDRLSFVLSLDEPIADKVIEATAAPADAPAERAKPMGTKAHPALQTKLINAMTFIEPPPVQHKSAAEIVAESRPAAQTAWEQITRKADELRAADASLTAEQATAKVLSESPALYAQYEDESAAGVYAQPATVVTKRSTPVNDLLSVEIKKVMADHRLDYADALAKVAKDVPALYCAAELEGH